jgi:hypothetical protein
MLVVINIPCTGFVIITNQAIKEIMIVVFLNRCESKDNSKFTYFAKDNIKCSQLIVSTIVPVYRIQTHSSYTISEKGKN